MSDAFRLPTAQGDQNSFDYGGTALAFDPQDQALWLVGHDWYQRVAEVSIPVPAIAATIDSLPRATLQRPFADILAGKLGSIGSGTAKIGSILPAGHDLIVSAYLYYDGSHTQVRSHFRVTPSGVAGPFQLGDAGAGFVSGYMTSIPMDWQAALGGTALTGQCCVPIVSRTSLGPAASVFNAADVGARDPVPATAVVGYPLEHPTIGDYDSNGQLYNGATSVAVISRPPTGPDQISYVQLDGSPGPQLPQGAGAPATVPGVRAVILLAGINDIDFATMPPRRGLDCDFPHTRVNAQALIEGYRKVIEDAHRHGLRIYGGTLTPAALPPEREAIRASVNQWIRHGGGFDGVVDFDAALRDPRHPTKLLPAYNSGDGIHPSDAGYAAMAQAVPLSLLRDILSHP